MNNKIKDDNSFVFSGYLIRFNEPNLNGVAIDKDAINFKDLMEMKVSGTILGYEIDDNGVKIVKKMKLNSASL